LSSVEFRDLRSFATQKVHREVWLIEARIDRDLRGTNGEDGAGTDDEISRETEAGSPMPDETVKNAGERELVRVEGSSSLREHRQSFREVQLIRERMVDSPLSCEGYTVSS
jgi:hypothetical protein